jgi:hypothetical protein
LEAVPDDNGAGPSGSQAPQWNAEDEVPTSPSTEFPDQYGGAFLPGYIEKAHDDPNASASIAFSPPVEFVPALPFSQRDFNPPVLPENDEDDYTAPPPDETYEESVVDSRYHSTQSGASMISLLERWNPNEGGTMLSMSKWLTALDCSCRDENLCPFIGQFPMLRPPSGSDFPRMNEGDSTEDRESFYRSSVTNLVEVTVNPRRANTTDSYDHDDWAAGPSDLSRRNTNVIQAIANFDQRTHLELHEEEAEDLYDDDERRFINPSLLSHLAVQLRDLVPRGTHVKGSIQYPRAFTGKDIVVCAFIIYRRLLWIRPINEDYSRPYTPSYNAEWHKSMVLNLRQTEEPQSWSRAAYRRPSFSTRWNGAQGCFKMVWRTCICSWTIKRVHQIHQLNERSCPLEWLRF